MTDRCLTVNGRTINYHTGHEWDFVFNDPGMTDGTTKIIRSETLPYSHLQMAIAMPEENEKMDDIPKHAAFWIKNDVSSRKKCLFDHRSRDVQLFEVLSENLILAKIKGRPKS